MASQLVRFDYLDPRPTSEALAAPIRRAVSIPLAELPSRVHELPPPNREIAVAADAPLLSATTAVLDGMGRSCRQAIGWEYGNNPVSGRLWEPNEFLLAAASDLRPGMATDLGCGTGRDCVALAAQGWSVQGFDRLPDALDRANVLSERYLAEEDLARLKFECLDYRKSDAWRQPCDLAILVLGFDRDVIRRMAGCLNPGGSLVAEAFTGTDASKMAALAELLADLPSLEIQHFSEGLRASGRQTARLWAKRV